MPNIKVFSGTSHPDLAAKIVERLGKYIFILNEIGQVQNTFYGTRRVIFSLCYSRYSCWQNCAQKI